MPTTITPAAATPDGIAGPPSTITSVAWVPKRAMDVAEWSRAGRQLGVMHRCSPWWLGDWIRYGNAKFGEKYSRAAKITGYDSQTLMNMVYVASHFEISRRREELSWSHHETVASLMPDEQDRWLKHAIDHQMSVTDLRLELRTCRKVQKEQSNPETHDDSIAESISVTCPNCGQKISLPPQAEEHPDVGRNPEQVGVRTLVDQDHSNEKTGAQSAEE